MKKSVLVIVLFAFFISCSTEQTNNAQKIKNDRSELNLKGNVKSVREINYTVIDKLGEIQKGNKQGESYILFNNKGNMIEQNSDAGVSRKFIFKYDDKGNKIEANFYKGSSSEVREKTTFKYDDKRNMIEAVDDNDGKRFTFKYDDNGNKIEANIYEGGSSSVSSKITFKYDDKGNNIEQSQCNSDGSDCVKQTFKYDDKGNKIEWKMYEEGRLEINETIKYKKFDRVDNWIESITINDIIVDKTIFITEREIEYY